MPRGADSNLQLTVQRALRQIYKRRTAGAAKIRRSGGPSPTTSGDLGLGCQFVCTDPHGRSRIRRSWPGLCRWRRPVLSGVAAPSSRRLALGLGRSSQRRDPPLCTLQGGFGPDGQPDAAVVCGGGRASPPAGFVANSNCRRRNWRAGPGLQRRHRWPVGAPGPSCMRESQTLGPARRSAGNAAHRADALVALNASPGVADARVRQSTVQNGSGCY